jgi:hypothetical protein
MQGSNATIGTLVPTIHRAARIEKVIETGHALVTEAKGLGRGR